MGIDDVLDTKDLIQMAIGGLVAYTVYITPEWVPSIEKNLMILLGVALLLFALRYKQLHREVPTGMKDRAGSHLFLSLGIAFGISYLLGIYLGQGWNKILTATIIAFPSAVIVDSLAGD